MSSEKYIGLDLHQATISVAVMNSQGMELLAGLRGSLFVTFEEGTGSAWLYNLLKPHVTEVLVCNPRKSRRSRGDRQVLEDLSDFCTGRP